MLDLLSAKESIKNYLPEAKVESYSLYSKGFIFKVNRNQDIFEDNFNPFYLVNKETGEVSEFSVTNDIPPIEFNKLIFRKVF